MKRETSFFLPIAAYIAKFGVEPKFHKIVKMVDPDGNEIAGVVVAARSFVGELPTGAVKVTTVTYK